MLSQNVKPIQGRKDAGPIVRPEDRSKLSDARKERLAEDFLKGVRVWNEHGHKVDRGRRKKV